MTVDDYQYYQYVFHVDMIFKFMDKVEKSTDYQEIKYFMDRIKIHQEKAIKLDEIINYAGISYREGHEPNTEQLLDI